MDDEQLPLIMTPDHPDFSSWLQILPPDWRLWAARNDGLGLIAASPHSGLLECHLEGSLNELIYDLGLYSDRMFADTF